MNASGRPNSARPTAKSRASLPRAESSSATKPPDEPADADRRVEQADARLVELEQLERRHDDEDVERAGDERLGGVEADERPQRRLARDRRDSRRGRRRSSFRVGRRCLARRLEVAAGRATRNADQRNDAPFAANTTSGLLTASSSPPSAGPRNVPTLSSVLDATFAAVSSDGERTSAGRSADCAGRKTVPAIVDSATSP